MHGNFESAAIFLSPTFPVAKKGPERKVGFDAATILAADAKTGIGKTGVELRYHTKKEFWALPEEQRREVADHNATKGGGNSRVWGSRILIQTRSEEPADILRALLKRSSNRWFRIQWQRPLNTKPTI